MSFFKGYLSISRRRGLITLLPKNHLLNCDYKIAAKSIASRLKKVLPHLTNNDQTGFPRGRFIGENISLINSLIAVITLRNRTSLACYSPWTLKRHSMLWNGPLLRKRFPSTISETTMQWHFS